jgi:cellulose synthase/poly-beta-1,6-N-acetylglucosamine synthase-like glycosyltransferase
MDLVVLGKIMFYICMTPLIIYSLKFYSIGFASIFIRGRKEEKPKEETFPKFSVHIPVYNDPVVVECVKSCLKFDYPKDRYEIIVIDDSDDEDTPRMLNKLKKETGGFRILRRGSRDGFKAGALNAAAKVSKGDIIVVFDSDYRLGADFLKKVAQPFADPEVAMVQTRWDYINPRKNIMSRVAMMSYSSFHQCSMPVKERIGSAIFCGTGGAIRKEVLFDAGMWNKESIGEDIDLTVRLLDKGYRQVYLPYVKSRGEVPETLKSFVKQQERWAYATTKVAKDYMGRIMRSEGLSKKQKLDMFFITTGFLIFPFILGVTISTIITMHPFFGGEALYAVFNAQGLMEAGSHIAASLLSTEGVLLMVLSLGYFFECMVAILMQKHWKDLIYLPWIFIVGFVIQFTNSVAVIKALLGIKHTFYKTPKLYYSVGT